MANPEHLAELQKGVEAWNKWRVDKWNLSLKPDLSNSSLPNLDLTGANLNQTDFSGTRLSGTLFVNAQLFQAQLNDADLTEANLVYANLSYAGLRGAMLRGANLTGANLTASQAQNVVLWGARLNGANFTQADLDGADLRYATAGWTSFGGVNLAGIIGLELIRHDGPSTIGVDTILQSNGEMPETFLRGCGVPEQFVTYARSLVAQPIEFYSCFISYSTKDQGFAERLYADLQSNAVRCWFAPHDIEGGKKVHDQIDEAIRVYDRLLLILSKDSMKSSWVETEISKARKREQRERSQMLFPVRLVDFETLRDWECFDADTGKDSAREIREYFIPDFSNWKDHDLYKMAFDRLLRDLKSKGDAIGKPA